MPRLLVIDDEEAFADGIAGHLRKAGYEVDVAYDADGARKLVKANHYDGVFCDFRLGKVMGSELCDTILDDETRSHCVLMSGASPDEVKGKSLTNYPLITKPISAETIVKHAKKLTAHLN